MGNNTILKEEQIWDNEQHAYLKEKGIYCHPNDLVIILGGLNYDLYNSPIGGSAWWITSSSDGDGDVRSVGKDGSRGWRVLVDVLVWCALLCFCSQKSKHLPEQE